jgi:ankyrin repeat domain-containing protein 50
VINQLQIHFPHFDVGVAFIYFQHKQSWKLQDLLGSILADVARSTWSAVSPKLIELYKKHHNKNSKPSVDEISQLLLSESNHFSKLFVVIDAADECSDSKILLKLLKELTKLRPILRLLVTGRPNIRTVEAVYSDCSVLRIKANEEDIRIYLDDRINEAEILKSSLDEDLTETVVKDRIIEKADGM